MFCTVQLDAPPTQPRPNAGVGDKQYFLGVDVGPVLIRAGVFLDGMRLVGKAKFSTKMERGPQAVIDRIAKCTHYAVDECDLKLNQIRGVAVGVKGWVDETQGQVRSSFELGWNDVALGDNLADQLALPVRVANSYRLAALGACTHEIRPSPPASALALFLGPDIGGALIRNGTWLTDAPVGPGLDAPQENVFRRIVAPEFSHFRSRDFRTALRRANRPVERFLNEVVDVAGDVAAQLITIWRPQAILIGGGAIDDIRENVVKRLRTKVEGLLQTSFGPDVPWIASALGDSATVAGGAVWARRSPEVLVS